MNEKAFSRTCDRRQKSVIINKSNLANLDTQEWNLLSKRSNSAILLLETGTFSLE